MLEGERSYQRGQENLVPSNNTSSAPENPVAPKAQENPWYIRHFTKLLIGFGLGGGAVALILPWVLWLHCGMSSGSSDQLRLHLLYVTGGIIAVLTLLQTNWKNQGDRLKIDADIKKNEQDAKNEAAKREQDAVKSERDHTRQVHAERRSRYTKAVEQLANEKAAVRLGGIYTLVGLVDEWLADDALNPEERQKEGQVIINNLCSYIRSPFPLAEHRESIEYLKNKPPKYWTDNIKNDENKLKEEQEVRQTIFREISFRIKQESTIKKSVGWNGLLYDFSNSEIFYPLGGLHFKNPDFSYSKFYGTANFYGSTFIDGANYTLSKFMGDAVFMESSFRGEASFREAKFYAATRFSTAGDQKAKFYDRAVFTRAKFRKYADFSGVNFHETDFSMSEFHENTDFSNAYFKNKATFQSALFKGDIIAISGRFDEKPDFHGALFNCNSKYHLFPTSRSIFYISASPAKITSQTGKQINKRIPLGAKLFDPDSWDQKEQKYTRISETAKPFENSDTEDEKPVE